MFVLDRVPASGNAIGTRLGEGRLIMSTDLQTENRSDSVSAKATETQQAASSLGKEAVDFGKEVVGDVVDIHNRNVEIKCLIIGAIYVFLGFAVMGSGNLDNPMIALAVVAYGAWLVSGFFTHGWRLLIY